MASSVPRIAQGRSLPAATSHRPRTQSSYLRGLASQVFHGWRPALREPQDEAYASWTEIASRTVDALHNSGMLSGGIDTAVGQMVGTQLKINLRPEIGVLGQEDQTETWARRVEARFEDWANDPWSCDVQGTFTLGQMTQAGVRQMFATGEQVAILPVIEREGSSHGTKVSVLPSSRLSQTTGLVLDAPPAFNRAIQGVLVGPDSAPRGYVFEERNLTTGQYTNAKVVIARDETGRPAVAHLHNNVGAYRGLSPLAPVLQVFRQWDQLQNATLTAALIQAIFAATVESPAPTAEVLKALQNDAEQAATTETGSIAPGAFDNYLGLRTEWYQNTRIDLGEFGKIVHLFAGEKLNFNRSEHPNATYEAFATMLNREIARCIGITHAQFTGNYVGETYTSLRMAIADIWIINLYRRAFFPARFNRMAFECWLEEDIERGLTPFPGGVEAFRAQKNAVCRSDWRGPARPTADDLKTAKAQQVQRQEGWVSTEMLSAEYETDHRDVIESQARTTKLREAAGLPPLAGSTPLGGGSFGQGGEAPGGGNATAAKAWDDQLVTALMNNDHAEVEQMLLSDRLSRR
jgi:lambda family phage portal protein